MKNEEFTAHLYGKWQFKYSIDELKLPDGFIKYHKNNFCKYFKIPEKGFSGLRVLDTGCGPGKHAVVLALMGAKVTGIDLSEENIQRGEKLKEFYKLDNLNFVKVDLMNPFDGYGEFDLISAHNWIQHTENPSIVLKNLISVLKMGGRLYLSTYHANTFRFFIAQIARNLLKKDNFDLMKTLVKFHYPAGFREFKNPDDIYMENIFDDFFVPYCHATTYDIVLEDAKKLGCIAITQRPELKEIYDIDNVPLRVGLEKKADVQYNGEFGFTKPVDEFSDSLPLTMCKSKDLSMKIIGHLSKLNDPYVICSFCLGLYRVRAATSRIVDIEKKHLLLQSYLEMTLSNTTKNISGFYDAQKYYG